MFCCLDGRCSPLQPRPTTTSVPGGQEPSKRRIMSAETSALMFQAFSAELPAPPMKLRWGPHL